MKEMDRIRLRIRKPWINLEMDARASPALIRELRKLLTEMESGSFPREQLPFELEYQLSDEIKNTNITNFIKSAYTVTDAYRYRKTTLTLREILDINRDKLILNIDKAELEDNLKKILYDIDLSKTDFMAVHVLGNVSSKSLNLIVDQIQKRVPNAEIKAAMTSKDMLGKLVIEILFFGSYMPKNDEPFFE